MNQFSTLLRAALIAGFALAIVQAAPAVAQSTFSSVPTPEFTPTYTPPPVVTRQPETPRVVGTPMRNIPDRLQEIRAPVNPNAAVNQATLPRRAVLNRLENRLATSAIPAGGNGSGKASATTPAARQILESAQPIL